MSVELVPAPVVPSAGVGESGADGGVEDALVAATETLSNVAVLSAAVLWLETTRPTTVLPAMASVVLPTVRHVDPSAEA